MQRVILVLVLLMSVSFISMGQTATETARALNRKRIINNIIEEKLRCNPDSVHDILRVRIAEEQQRRIHNTNTRALLSEGESNNNGILSADFNNKKVSIGINTESEIHAVINPTDTNNMVCSANGVSSSLYMPLYYTKDFGTTWKKSAYKPGPRKADAFVLGGGDPMFAFDATGKLYFSWINLYAESGFEVLPMAMFWAKSTDGGVTWLRDTTNDAVLMGSIKLQDQENSIAADKQWMMCDISDSPYRNNLYCSLLHTAPGENRIGVRIKPANAEGFVDFSKRPSNNNYTFNQFTSIDVDDKGWVHASFVGSHETGTEFKQMEVWQMVSKDGGATFLHEVKVSDAYFLAQNPSGTPKPPTAPTGIARVQVLPQIACDKYKDSPYKGNVYCAWTAVGINKEESNGLDIYFSSSTDGGATWLPATIVNDDAKGKNTTQAYVTVAVNKNGVIGLAWHDRRDDAIGSKAHYYMTYSFDGGKTFIKNFPVTSAPTLYSTFTGQNDFGMGEYNQLLMTEGYAIPFWGDGRSQSMTIYTAKVPINNNPYQFPSGAESITPLSEEFIVQEITPNPINSTGQLSFTLSSPSEVEYIITDIHGNTVTSKALGIQQEGTHTISLPLSNISTGSYYVRINSKFGFAVRKVVKVQ